MHGNVFEWVEDTWHEGYDGAPADGTPWVQGGDATRRVIRGGSWLDAPPNLRAANRDQRPSSTREPFIGFRLARTLKP
jgi:formylglycine-generating enzyme required for sulfatase activity